MTSLLRDIRANSFVTLSLSRDITTVSSPLKILSSQKRGPGAKRGTSRFLSTSTTIAGFFLGTLKGDTLLL
jgi:hypothetical protein